MVWRRIATAALAIVTTSALGACTSSGADDGENEKWTFERDSGASADTWRRDAPVVVRDTGGEPPDRVDTGSDEDTGSPEDTVGRGRDTSVDPVRDTGARTDTRTSNECPTAVATAGVKRGNRSGRKITTRPLETVQLDGAASCGDRAIVEITARPSHDIHVQLVWETPADSDPSDTKGTDLDLHYLNPKGQWNEAPYEIFWHNKTADWGRKNYSGDDPSLDIDDTDGAGPENVNHNDPVNGKTYAVGVYYNDANGFGPSFATVRIYIDGRLTQEYGRKKLEKTFDFWKVGLIEWPSKNVYKRDEMFRGFPNE